MVDVAQQRVTQSETTQHAQQNLELANIQPEKQKQSIIAATSKGLWVFDSEQRIELENCSVNTIAPSADGLWAVVDRNSVWHRNLSGEWRKVTSSENLQLNCILPINGTVLVGTSKAHLMRVVEGSLQSIESFENAEGRDEWYTPWGGLPDVRSLAVGASGEWYINIHVGGILHSRDEGKTWQPTLDIHADVHEVRTVSNRPGLVLAATAQGFAVSSNGGDSWTFDRANLHAIYARAVAVCGDTVLMSVSLGPSGGKAAIYRRQIDEPGTFEKCDRGLPEWFSDNINTRCIATSENIAVFGTHDGQIFLSNDAGVTWQRIAAGLAPVQGLSFAHLPTGV